MACVRRLLAILKSYCPIDPTTQRELKIIELGRQAARQPQSVAADFFSAQLNGGRDRQRDRDQASQLSGKRRCQATFSLMCGNIALRATSSISVLNLCLSLSARPAGPPAGR